MKFLRVLLVEDREDDALLVLDELRRGGFTVTHERVETAEAMRAALAEQTWDVIVSDYSMPVFTGIRALEVLHESGLDIPLIVCSGTIGEETAVAALKAGAADFFSKDRLIRLVPAIERELREAEGRRRRRHAEDALEAVRSRMQLTLEALTIGISEIDLRTDTVVLSAEFERLHGIASGRSPTTVQEYLATIAAEDRTAVAQSIELSARRGLESVLEYRVKWPDQSVHWIRVIGRTLHSDTGVPLRAVGIGVDVTAQRSLEDQFRQAQKLRVAIEMRPPRGSASRALTTRLISTCSIWPASAVMAGSDSASARSMRTFSSTSRRSILWLAWTMAFTSSDVGATIWRREKASSWRVRDVALSPAFLISRTSSSTDGWPSHCVSSISQ